MSNTSLKDDASNKKVQGHPNKGLLTPHPVTGKVSKKPKRQR
jgi:hypothetical protein